MKIIKGNMRTVEVTEHELELLRHYRQLPPEEQAAYCRFAGLQHPDVKRAKIKAR